MPPSPLLFHSPNDWTSNQLEDLRLVRHFNASLDEIIGDDYLPKDGDEEFESLAMEFAEPTENELKNLWRTATRARYRRNIFLPVFRPLCEMLNSDVFFGASNEAVLSFMEIILRRVHLNKPLQSSRIHTMSFEVTGIRGEVECEGVLLDCSMPHSPLVVFSVAKDGDYNFKGQVAQLLLQKTVAYQRNLSRRAFVIFMDSTNLQLTMADPPRVYLDALLHGERPDNRLHLYHSEFYNLCNRRRRKEALRVMLGLVRLLDADGLTRRLP
ncbi:hypothetical protein ASPFODRAFT_700039 [Aspergillus luchuensis CBS 106.47]|uniref:Uncharacterized protein n=1 Tax=Aspergillus luchuensis (strain CBS 106.47) TaxID=1137211 RepID=A0A1M3T767_ASPLC|nr:hypothetical protein ASPFODRAFT_700039 [Aspergillus luchuensis CBS 106.47]